MPSVSEITQYLIDIVQANADLQDVWIRGKISNVRHIRNGPLNFTFADKSKKIDCVIFDNGPYLRENLPTGGNSVFVKGQIFVYGVSSEYRFKVTDIKLSENLLSDQPISVTSLIEILENTILNHTGEVQGQIADIYDANIGWTNFKLKTATANEALSSSIECSLPPSIAKNLPFPLTAGEEISVKGKFKIFSARNVYQVVINDMADIKRVPGAAPAMPTSHCNECGQSHDTIYELCPMCHYAQVTHEGIVVGAVMRYFEKFNNFSIQREYWIKLIGTIKGRADVVLLDSQGNLTAIAECKRIGYNGNDGIDQLKSYLFPRDTKLGLFADDTNPNGWTFLKNLGKGEFTEITRSDFETIVKDEKPLPPPDEPNPIPLPIPSKPASRVWQYFTGVLGVALCICLTVLIMQLDEKNKQTQEYTYKNSKLESEKQNLQKQITEKDNQIPDNTRIVLELESENKTLVSKKQNLQKQIAENEEDIKSLITENNEQKLRIEELVSQLNGNHTKGDPPPLLNINTATAKELDDLPVTGISEKLSGKIIQYRKQNGNFATVDDITKVSGIGEKTLEKLREFIYVE